MPQPRSVRPVALLLLASLLLAPAAFAGELRPDRHATEKKDTGTLRTALLSFWSDIAALWEKEGSSLDPFGQPKPEGSSLDPFGNPVPSGPR